MDGGSGDEPRSPTSASVATSVVVQVGESLSNLRLSGEDSTSVQQRGSQKSRPPPPAFRVKVRYIVELNCIAELRGIHIVVDGGRCTCWSQEEWDDSTVSSNVSRMRIQSRIEATTRRERALAYAFSQQVGTRCFKRLVTVSQ